MTSKLKVFVCEFITGGGLYSAPLPASLAREGGLMLESLLADLLALERVELLVTRDARLPALPLPVDVKTLKAGMDPWPLWRECIANVDAIWPIAPESGGLLEKLSALSGSKRLLGCTPQAVQLAASKHATAAHLAQHGIAAVPTWRAGELAHPALTAPDPVLIAKPDDGVGGEDARVFESRAALADWLAQGRTATHVIQPWLPGEAASLSMLCANGEAQLLSCNRQLIALEDSRPVYRGSVLNGMAAYWEAFETLAKSIARAIPGLAGYVGVDVLVDGDRITVLEINPRLTTSYAGLHRALGRNPAGLVLDLLYNGRWTASDRLQRNVVEVIIDG